MAKRKKTRSEPDSADKEQPAAGSGPAETAKPRKKKKVSGHTKNAAGKTSARQAPSDESAADTNEATFPIVGIGASAGGIEAFSQVLENLPDDTGMAFVFIQHLHPGYESALTEILARETKMPVVEAGDDMAVVPNHVYVIPPGSYLGIQEGVLYLLPRPEPHERRLPVDQFFRYLAADRGTGAIGVVLSGTGSDGVLGLKAIKAEGGITFAQDEATAKYDGMPHSAFASGTVDFVLPPDRIAAELEHIAGHPLVARGRAAKRTEALTTAGDNMEKIFMMMRRRTGHDFTYYKPATIQRRIRRRMVLHKLERLEDYVRYLQENPGELDELFQDMLINVTDFFRDPEVFDLLAEKVFPQITPEGATDRPVRIWVPGCSSGEEAYSIAIAYLEFLGDRWASTPVQIFGTDIDEVAINQARTGLYPENIKQDVSAERLRRFFTPVEGGYQISKTIRDMCVFALQNVAKDPPFSRLDLISCRNLLIYLGPVLQRRIMRTFHYALNPDAFLLLGSAESIGGFADMFRAVDAKAKIYARKATTAPLHVEFGMALEGGPPVPEPGSHQPAPAERTGGDSAADLQRDADRLLMSKYGPPGVVIGDDMEILLFRGHTGPYLEPTPGEASFNLLKMAREDLMVGLNAAVRESIASNAATSRNDVRVKVNGATRCVDIEVTPLPGAGGERRYYLVVFKEVPLAQRPDEGEAEGEAGERLAEEKDSDVVRLEQELTATKEYLQSVIEQKETNNEELRSANEEIQSSNEELQSINEELETAKEELQSTNEELATVNEELESRNEELARANNDLQNLVASVEIPIVIVGQDLRIRRYTPQAEKLLNLINTDVGRPISDVKPNIDVPGFGDMLTSAVDDVRPAEREVQDHEGRWYTVRVRPYRTQENKIDGAVAVFLDVDSLKQSLDETRSALDYAEAIVNAVRHPLLVLDRDLRVASASASYLETFRVTDKETRDNLVHRLGNGQWAIPGLRERLEKVVAEGKEFHDFEVEHEFERIGERTFRVSGRRVPAKVSEGPMVLMQIEAADEQSDGEEDRAP